MTGTGATEWAVLAEAHEALRTAVRGVPANGWSGPTPCAEWNVTQVLQHAAGDQIAYAAALTGGPGPSENPFEPSGKLSEDPVEFAEAALKTTADAWAAVAPDTGEVAVPIPPGRLTAALGVRACALDAAVHAWDIARATGGPSPLTPALAAELLGAARQLVEPLRAFAFAPAIGPQEGDDAAAELLRYVGRRPDWTA
ncbi:TIGR03086 family metal-binding protein [Streptomyces beijiangensis]|uniref:TIGR03086 family protein n=1 Tax=Streptomyces beijiangensis TaxID=163361 RepID=A0A939F9J0_9ACTN|nr:TIGR03086 family metal-binding protein [Streptomyces beijiangensis]MBO0514028.1 TIGR03086 family protein [Streptomyces beijiangensis]